MEKTKTNKLIVHDYTTGLIHNYKIDKDVFVNTKYIRALGYNPDNVVYMFGDLQIREHPGILTKSVF